MSGKVSVCLAFLFVCLFLNWERVNIDPPQADSLKRKQCPEVHIIQANMSLLGSLPIV